MADEIKKVQKQIAEEQAKRLADEKALREEANKEISKSTNTASKEFKAVINNLAKVRPEAAAIVADFKGLAADSFKGAVLNRDLIKGMEAATEMSKDGWSSLSAEQQDLLSEVFGGQIDHIRGLEKQHEEITKAREVQLRKAAMSQQKLSAFEEEQTEFKKSLLEEQQQKVAEAERAMQENQFRNKEKHYEGLLAQEQNRLADLEKQADAQIKEKYGKEEELLKKDLEAKKLAIDSNEKKLKEIEEYQANAGENLKEALDKSKEEQMKGLSDFSDGVKQLVGVDIMGALDSATKNLNALGKVLGTDGPLGDKIIGGLFKGMQNAGKGIANATAGLRKGIGGFIKGGIRVVGTAFTTIGTSLAAAGTALMTTLTAFATGAAAFIGGLAATAGGMLLAAAPYILAGVAIVGLVLAGMKLYEESEGFKAAVDTVIGYFIDIKDSIFKIFGGFFDFWKGLFTGDFDLMFGGLKDMFGGLWDLIKAPFKAIGDFFKNVFGIDIGKFIKDMAKKMLPDWAVDLIFGSGNEAPEMTEEAAKAGKDAAKESGLYEERGLRKSLVNMDMVATAPTNQLEAILNDDDISDESYEAIQRELDNRKSIIAEYEEVTSAIAAGQKTLADGTTADNMYVEMLEEEIAMRGGAIDQATIDARPKTPTAGGGETVVQQNNNNSSTNIMNDTNSARDENDRYFDMLLEGTDY